MEGRVIPADRRGSCCFLLGIVTVTLHGASHAGITNKSSQSVLENHPVSSGKGARGRFRSRGLGKGGEEGKKSSVRSGCSFCGLDSRLGVDKRKKNYAEIRPAPSPVSIKDHLPSFLPWQDFKEKHNEKQVFSSKEKKISLDLLCCSEGEWGGVLRYFAASFYARQKEKKPLKNK